MAVSEQTAYVASTGNGVTTVFPFAFKVLAEGDLAVYVAGALKTLNVDYSVSGVGVDAGGTVTFLTGAPASGDEVIIARNMPRTRTTDYQNQGDFLAATVNPDFDRAILLLQDLAAQLGRSVRAPIYEPNADLELPPRASRAGKFFAFDTNGDLELATDIGNAVALTSSLIGLTLNSLKRTASEISAAITPVDYAYLPGDSRRYATLQQAIDANVGGVVRLAPGTTALGTTSLVIPALGIRLVGDSKEGSALTYSGTGSAIDAYGASNFTIENLRVQTTNVAANGIRVGNGARHIVLRNLAFYGSTSSSNTGTGVLCQAGSPGLFSGNLTLENVYTLGYKWGLKAVGTDLATNTWTTITGVGCYFLGRAAGVIAGGAGIYFDALTNGIGSSFIGGTVESFDVGLKVDNGGSGFDYRGDLEGNGSKYSVGATFNGHFETPNVVDFHASTNGATNVWHKRRQLNGDTDYETYYDQYHTFYDASGLSAQFVLARGASKIDGGSPTTKFRVVMGTAGNSTPQANYQELLGKRMSWASAAPTGGTWSQGDIVWNTGVAAGGSPGWVCTTGGTPGTWKAMANVAA